MVAIQGASPWSGSTVDPVARIQPAQGWPWGLVQEGSSEAPLILVAGCPMGERSPPRSRSNGEPLAPSNPEGWSPPGASPCRKERPPAGCACGRCPRGPDAQHSVMGIESSFGGEAPTRSPEGPEGDFCPTKTHLATRLPAHSIPTPFPTSRNGAGCLRTHGLYAAPCPPCRAAGGEVASRRLTLEPESWHR
ncbi:hypothetical protein Pla133_52840 (plasmid) [Planctomycetes bacterium Pla133]|uniref:Uncharacterized protein n=1 Tax=Engelhardtia mirabilis TaxID=2528011 RepID=A0A518BT63_9BACT|nr:hypothetical protein Pla133_52840 [Planctomycetes bacterium Pla133]